MSFMDRDFKEMNGVFSVAADKIGFSLDEKYKELEHCNEEIEKSYYDLGKSYYISRGKDSDGNFDEMIRKIDRSRKEAEKIQEEIDQVSSLALCPKCGSRNSNGIVFCPYCGTKLEGVGDMAFVDQKPVEEMPNVAWAAVEEPVIEEKVKEEKVKEEKVKEEKIKSATTGFKAMKINIEKGKAKQEDNRQLSCPVCGSSVEEDDVFCMNCGNKLK